MSSSMLLIFSIHCHTFQHSHCASIQFYGASYRSQFTHQCYSMRVQRQKFWNTAQFKNIYHIYLCNWNIFSGFGEWMWPLMSFCSSVFVSSVQSMSQEPVCVHSRPPYWPIPERPRKRPYHRFLWQCPQSWDHHGNHQLDQPYWAIGREVSWILFYYGHQLNVLTNFFNFLWF